MEKQMSKNMKLEDMPSFYKIMLAGDHTSQHLQIPPDFVKYMSKEVTDEAILKGPCGGHWHIKLHKKEDGLYLQEGWQTFVRENLLGDNEFLVFRYDGNMCFNVTIFSKSGCERTKVPISRSCQELNLSHGKRKCGRPRKSSISTIGSKFHEDDPDQKLPWCKSKEAEKLDTKNKVKTEELELPTVGIDSQLNKFKEEDTKRKKRPIDEERIWKTAQPFTCKFPFFQTCLKDYNASRVFVLIIPTEFSRTHLTRSRSEIVLRNSEGREWVVNLIPTPAKTHAICGGWSAFVCDNQLKIGDDCIFELVHQNLMNVHFFRSDQKSS